VLALIAAALAASAPAPLDASRPWWERITVTVDDKGAEQSCKYESSLSAKGVEVCDDKASGVKERDAQGRSGLYSKLTFERRFSPGGKLDSGRLQPGDKLLARQVLFLTIVADGSVQSCRVVATSGDMLPDYGCEEARAEKFRAQASGAAEATRQAFMTVLVYGHTEQIA